MFIDDESERAAHSGIWVLGDVGHGKLRPVTLELLGNARELAASRRQEVWAVLLGARAGAFVQTLWEHGADTVLHVDSPALDQFDEEAHAAAMKRLIEKYRPEILLAGATAVGRSLAPMVAVAANCGLTADCTSLAVDPDSGALLQTRPAFGGSLMATIRSDRCLPQMATVRPGVMKALPASPGAKGKLVREAFEDASAAALKTILGEFADANSAADFGNASFVVAGGRGMRGAEGFHLLQDFATMFGGVVGATRAAVDAGWAPYGMQVGQTGRTVQARVYIACGISGQIQHLVGMQTSDLIIAINNDPEAPIMKMADLAVVGDAFEILPAIMAAMRESRGGVAA